MRESEYKCTWTCDVCGASETFDGTSHPNGWKWVEVLVPAHNFNKTHKYKERMDVCHECFPYTPSERNPPKDHQVRSFIKRLFKKWGKKDESA